MQTMEITNLGPCNHPSPIPFAVPENMRVPANEEWMDGTPPNDLTSFEKAGPRAKIFFDPAKTKAAIVTCGGLCPGLNNVIRSAFLELYHGYGVRNVVGFQCGYQGLLKDAILPPVQLTVDMVSHIHKAGGTILGTSRGPVDVAKAVDNLMAMGINILFCVGGDGTQRGGRSLFEEAEKRKHPLAVVGIPKTIDNDIWHVQRTFGFTTAVEEAKNVIDRAHTEATSVFNGVSVVRLMGREAGFIAAAATVASQDVNFCLIPEKKFKLEGPRGLLDALEKRLTTRRHAVVVVAEGAGQDLMPDGSQSRDDSGNIKLKDIGKFLCDAITKHFKSRNIPMTMRYFDPNYFIRSCPANMEDAVLCDQFARHAVHAAMAGKTGMIVGLESAQYINVPVEAIPRMPKRIKPAGELLHAVISATGQNAFLELN